MIDGQNFWVVIGCRDENAKPVLLGILGRDEAQDPHGAIGKVIVRAEKKMDFSSLLWRFSAFFFDESDDILTQEANMAQAFVEVGMVPGDLRLNGMIHELCTQIAVQVLVAMEKRLVRLQGIPH